MNDIMISRITDKFVYCYNDQEVSLVLVDMNESDTIRCIKGTSE